MSGRSTSAEVRNPLLALPSAQRLLKSDEPITRDEFALLLQEMSKDAVQRAQKSWRTHKAPMALYWKALSVYARHFARLLRSASNAR